jgi:hypothetical protein
MRFEPDHTGWMAYVKVGWGPAGKERMHVRAVRAGGSGRREGSVSGRPWGMGSRLPLQLQLPRPAVCVCVCPAAQFELRYHELDRARAIFERYVQVRRLRVGVGAAALPRVPAPSLVSSQPQE